MSTCTLLWAAGVADLIPFVVAVIVAVLSILFQYLRNQAGGANQQQQQQGQRPPNQPPRPRPQQQQIDEEIGEFLRRAAQRRGAPPAVRPATVAVPEERPVAAVVVPERPVGGEVERHVQRHLDSRQFDQRSQQLGADVAQADEKVETHLRDVFARDMSGTGSPKMSAADRAALAAPPQTQVRGAGALGDTALVSLLTNPDSIREAIILNEILRRPDDRW